MKRLPRKELWMGAVAATGIALLLVWLRVRPAPQPAGAPAVGGPAPELRLPDVAGQTATLAQYRGKVVVLDFWATWCESCNAELPSLQALYKKHRAQGLEVLAASVDQEGRKAVLPYIAQYGVEWRVLLADDRTVKAYAVFGLPTTYVIDARGAVARRYVGPVDPDELEHVVEDLLGRRS